jgi:hypothetical protein
MTMPLALLLAMVALLILVASILYQLVKIARDVRALRYQVAPELREALLQRSWAMSVVTNPLRHGDPGTGPHHQRIPAVGCFVLWEWRAGRWHCSSEGGEPADALKPGYPGAFEGDLAKTWNPNRR